MPRDPNRFRKSRAHTATNVFLGMRWTTPGQPEAVRRRLAHLFEVAPDAVVVLVGPTTASFFLPGEADPYGRAWCYTDVASLSASAHPLLVPEVLDDPSGRGLRGFVVNLRHESTALEDVAPPLSYLHHNAIRDTVVAANDSFGLGRLYLVDTPGHELLSNSIQAAAVALEQDVVQDEDYWDAYYVAGAGLGSRSYARGISLAPGGAVASISAGGLTLRQHHPVERLLRAARTSEPDRRAPLVAAQRVLETAGPYLGRSARLGLSGGVDSRFVAAVTLDLGLRLRTHTYVPPDLEGQIAERLSRSAHVPYAWRRLEADPGTVRQDARPAEAPGHVLGSILERADAWFSYFGGDHWSSLVRSSAPARRTRPLTLSLSGSHGDMSRGHYYTARDLDDPTGAELPLRRYLRSFSQYRTLLPEDLRRRGAQQMRDAVLEAMVQGITGHHALDYMYLSYRMRRQFPPVVPTVVLPMLTPEMLLTTFWREPREKLDATAVRDLTAELVPGWRDVPYYHEAARGTDPDLTNKVSVQTTYWEADPGDFWSAVEESLGTTDHSGISMDSARREVTRLPEGRNRTNQTFEFLFWHGAGVRALARVNEVRRLHPVGETDSSSISTA